MATKRKVQKHDNDPGYRTISVRLPVDLLDTISAMAETRQTEVDVIIRTVLRTLNSSLAFYSLSSVMRIGRYRGAIVDEIIRTDPDYIVWCCKNVNGFCLDEEALKVLETCINSSTGIKPFGME